MALAMGEPIAEQVEFHGGPFDGHRHAICLAPQRLARDVALPINRNVIAMLLGRRPGRKQRASCVAVYHLTLDQHRCCYRFLATRPPSYFQLEDWQG